MSRSPVQKLLIALSAFLLIGCGGDASPLPDINATVEARLSAIDIQATVQAKVKETIEALPTPTPVPTPTPLPTPT